MVFNGKETRCSTLSLLFSMDGRDWGESCTFLYTEDNVTVIDIDTEIDTVTAIDTVPLCGRR